MKKLTENWVKEKIALEAQVAEPQNERKAQVAELTKELNAAKKELQLWVLFWGWVKTHSKPTTLRWLQKLWQKGASASARPLLGRRSDTKGSTKTLRH